MYYYSGYVQCMDPYSLAEALAETGFADRFGVEISKSFCNLKLVHVQVQELEILKLLADNFEGTIVHIGYNINDI